MYNVYMGVCVYNLFMFILSKSVFFIRTVYFNDCMICCIV